MSKDTLLAPSQNKIKIKNDTNLCLVKGLCWVDSLHCFGFLTNTTAIQCQSSDGIFRFINRYLCIRAYPLKRLSNAKVAVLVLAHIFPKLWFLCLKKPNKGAFGCAFQNFDLVFWNCYYLIFVLGYSESVPSLAPGLASYRSSYSHPLVCLHSTVITTYSTPNTGLDSYPLKIWRIWKRCSCLKTQILTNLPTLSVEENGVLVITFPENTSRQQEIRHFRQLSMNFRFWGTKI